MVTMKGKKKHFGLIVMKLHMNVFGMCSCALMIEYFKMATVAMISMKVEKILFLSDCNETLQE